MLKLRTQYRPMNYFDFDIPYSTHTVVHFDEKGCNLLLRLPARSQTSMQRILAILSVILVIS
jgi:hypothetical protein